MVKPKPTFKEIKAEFCERIVYVVDLRSRIVIKCKAKAANKDLA